MRNQRDLAEEYDRFLKEQPAHLSDDQRARILALSSDLPTLWNAPETTAADRKEIIRLVVDRVVVHVRADSECAEAVIWWRGGVTTRHAIVRPVSRYESLGHYDQLINRIVELRQEGRTIKQIAAQLNGEGYHTPRSRKGYTSTSVRKLLSRWGVIAPVPGIMRLFWAFSSSNPPESPSQEDSSLANMLDTLEARCRSDGPPAGPRSIDPLPGSRSFLTVSAVA